MLSLQTIIFAALGGLLPALLWLWFWLKEDSRCPEPRLLIVLTFIAGMIAVPIVLPLERYTESFASGTIALALWAAIEEIFKYIAALVVVLWRKVVNEPVDAVIYMITVALGFAALENTLFLLSPFIDGDFAGGILTGNLRFLGATLLHTLSSAMIGLALALSFYKSRVVKKIYLFGGVVLAIVLHTLFNFFIMNSNGESILSIFFVVWIGIVVLILLFERVKRIRRPITSLIKRK